MGLTGHLPRAQAPQLQTEGSTGILGTHLSQHSSANIATCGHWPARGFGSESGRFQSLLLPKQKRRLWGTCCARRVCKAREEAALVPWAQQLRAGEEQEIKARGGCCPALPSTAWHPHLCRYPHPGRPLSVCQAGRRKVFSNHSPETLESLKGKQMKLKILFNLSTKGRAQSLL